MERSREKLENAKPSREVVVRIIFELPKQLFDDKTNFILNICVRSVNKKSTFRKT